MISPVKIDMTGVERLLIVKMSAMGDIIHALPVSAALKRSFPHLSVYWAVEDRFAALVRDNPYLSGVIELPKMSGSNLSRSAAWGQWTRQLRAVRQLRFDICIDLQGLTKSAIVAGASGAKVRLAYHWLRELAPLFERPIPQRPESVHIVDQYLDVAYALGADVRNPLFPLEVPAEEDAYICHLLADAGLDPAQGFISINPASAQKLKEWGTERYGRLINMVSERLGIPCVLVTADKEVASSVMSATRTKAVNLAGKTNLMQLVALLRRSSAHVCGDTGSGHIAACFGIPVVSIVGPTDPDRSCPYGQRANTLSRRDLCGSACRTHHCQYSKPHCLEGVDVEEVATLICWRVTQPEAPVDISVKNSS